MTQFKLDTWDVRDLAQEILDLYHSGFSISDAIELLRAGRTEPDHLWEAAERRAYAKT